MRLAFASVLIVVLGSCALIERIRPGPTLAPLISASFLSVRLIAGDASDAQERARVSQLRDAIAGALPDAWATATRGRGRLSIRTDADIDVKLDGTAGTSAFAQHTRGGKVISRTIVVHTLDGSRRLTLPELVATTLHELGHIWCCFGPGTSEGHWTDTPLSFSPIGLMGSPMVCQASRGADPVCPNVFSDRELAELFTIRP